jgi:hypothetical protein
MKAEPARESLRGTEGIELWVGQRHGERDDERQSGAADIDGGSKLITVACAHYHLTWTADTLHSLDGVLS